MCFNLLKYVFLSTQLTGIVQKKNQRTRKELYDSIKIQRRVFHGAVGNYNIEIFTIHLNTT